MHSIVTNKNESWPRLIWPTMYSKLGNEAMLTVSGVAQWKNVGLWPANFPWPAPDLQLMGNHLQGGAKKQGHAPAILSHCKYSENSMTELHENWWTSAILYAEHSH